ncbi:MAG: hypothetical protein QM723_17355 [Myxococcaceae bacterium]
MVLLIACPGRLADPNEFLDGGGDGGVGGGGGGSDGGCDVEHDIFLLKCSTSGACHLPPASAADNLDLTDAGIRQYLLTADSQCNGGIPFKTYMITKVVSTSPPCGFQMPLGGPYLSAAEITCLQNYLDGGP